MLSGNILNLRMKNLRVSSNGKQELIIKKNVSLQWEMTIINIVK